MCLFRISFPIHENARFRGWERKNEPSVHESGCFRGWERENEPSVHEKSSFWGRGPGYLLYLHDLGVILSASEGSVNGKYKLILYKMAEFKDGIPIMYQQFCVNFAD